MKAAIYRRYGPPDVVQLEDLAKAKIETGQESSELMTV